MRSSFSGWARAEQPGDDVHGHDVASAAANAGQPRPDARRTVCAAAALRRAADSLNPASTEVCVAFRLVSGRFGVLTRGVQSIL